MSYPTQDFRVAATFEKRAEGCSLLPQGASKAVYNFAAGGRKRVNSWCGHGSEVPPEGRTWCQVEPGDLGVSSGEIAAEGLVTHVNLHGDVDMPETGRDA